VSPAPFEVRKEELDGRISVIAVHGELDMSTAPQLERELDATLADTEASLILDLSACEFIDSTGIALVVRSWQQLDREAGGEGRGRLVICSQNHQVRRLLEITGVEASISMHEQRDAALAELRG
jgi:anti-anti-sigma factor